jgi:hypothetical protein
VNAIAISLLLASHFLCVNLASGGPLLAAWLDWRGTRGEDAAAKAAVYLARASLAALLAGTALGVLIGWLKWDADYRSLWLGPLSYKLKGAVIEIVFSFALILGWWLWLPGKSGGSWVAMITRILLAALAATNLLYHFPLLFSVAAHLQAGSQTAGPTISGADFRRLLDAESLALMTHVALASLATAGMMLLGLALRWQRHGETAPASVIGRTGSRWALVSSLLQLPVGLWLLMSLRPDAQSQLLGESTIGVLLFVASLLAALWLLNDLSQLALGEFSRRLAIRSMIAMLVTIILMTLMQQQSRL